MEMGNSRPSEGRPSKRRRRIVTDIEKLKNVWWLFDVEVHQQGDEYQAAGRVYTVNGHGQIEKVREAK